MSITGLFNFTSYFCIIILLLGMESKEEKLERKIEELEAEIKELNRSIRDLETKEGGLTEKEEKKIENWTVRVNGMREQLKGMNERLTLYFMEKKELKDDLTELKKKPEDKRMCHGFVFLLFTLFF